MTPTPWFTLSRGREVRQRIPCPRAPTGMEIEDYGTVPDRNSSKLIYALRGGRIASARAVTAPDATVGFRWAAMDETRDEGEAAALKAEPQAHALQLPTKSRGLWTRKQGQTREIASLLFQVRRVRRG